MWILYEDQYLHLLQIRFIFIYPKHFCDQLKNILKMPGSEYLELILKSETN